MWYLIGEILAALVFGLLIGAAIGWVFRDQRAKKDLNELNTYWLTTKRRLESRLTEFREHLQQADQRHSHLERTLDEKLSALKRVAGDLGPAERQVTDLESQVVVLQLEHRALARHLEATGGRGRELEEALQMAQQRVAEYEPLVAECTEREARIEELSSLVASADTRIAQIETEYQSEMEQVEATHRRELEAKDKRIERLQAELQQIKEAVGAGTSGGNGRNGRNGRRSGNRIAASPDNLQQIRGIGQGIEKVLNRMGIHTFEQIADWSPEEMERVSEELGPLQNRINRDRWVAQARKLAKTKA